MVPTVSLRTNDFALAGTGDLAARRPEWPIAWSPGGSQGAVNGYGFAPAPFPSNGSKHQVNQQSHTGAALVFLKPTPTTVAARSVIAILSSLSKPFNACHSTKKRSARPNAR
jgi:hypothetical protein